MPSLGFDELQDQYREQLQDKIAKAVARRRSSVADSPEAGSTGSTPTGFGTLSLQSTGSTPTGSSIQESVTPDLGIQGTPLRSHAGDVSVTPGARPPVPTPTTIAVEAGAITPRNRAQPDPASATGSASALDTPQAASILIGGRSQVAPARLEFGEDANAPGFGHANILSPMADKKSSLYSNASATQVKEEDEGNKENVGNLLQAEGPPVWDGRSPVDSPEDPPQNIHRRRSSISSCGSDSEGSPTKRVRNSLGTQERELQDGLRQVQLRKRFLMEKESDLDQQKSALEKRSSQLLLYEAEVQQREAQLEEKEAALLSHASSRRSRLKSFLSGLLRLAAYANVTWNVMHAIPGFELSKIIATDTSLELQSQVPQAGTTEISIAETYVANMPSDECPKVQDPCPEPPLCNCNSANPSVLRFQVPWSVDGNNTAASISNQACVPAEATNAQLAFEWSSQRIQFLQREVDRLHTLIEATQRQKQPQQTALEAGLQRKEVKNQTQQKKEGKSQTQQKQPLQEKQQLQLQPQQSLQQPVEKAATLQQTVETAMISKWKVGAISSALFGGCFAFKLAASFF